MDMKNMQVRLRLGSYGRKTELAVLARDLGHEFPRNRVELLDEFRAMVADHMPLSEYACGYLDALREITAAYSAAIQPEVEEKEAMHFLREHGLKHLMLALLERMHATAEFLQTYECLLAKAEPHSLKKAQDMLGVLCQLGLVETLGDLPYYRLTLLGERVAARLKKENQ